VEEKAARSHKVRWITSFNGTELCAAKKKKFLGLKSSGALRSQERSVEVLTCRTDGRKIRKETSVEPKHCKRWGEPEKDVREIREVD